MAESKCSNKQSPRFFGFREEIRPAVPPPGQFQELSQTRALFLSAKIAESKSGQNRHFFTAGGGGSGAKVKKSRNFDAEGGILVGEILMTRAQLRLRAFGRFAPEKDR